MKKPNDLWADIGSLTDEEMSQVITRLVALYGERLDRNPEDREALLFFRNLDTAISQVTQCNLNRRWTLPQLTHLRTGWAFWPQRKISTQLLDHGH